MGSQEVVLAQLPAIPWSRPRWRLSETRSVPETVGGFSLNSLAVTSLEKNLSKERALCETRPSMMESVPEPPDRRLLYTSAGRRKICNSEVARD